MQLAGVVGIGTPQEGIRPDLLQYVLVKDQEVCNTHAVVKPCY